MEPPPKKIRLFNTTVPPDILDWRITSFSDIIYLSTQSYGSLYSKVVDFAKIKAFSIEFKDLLKTCHENIVKIYIIYHSLTSQQQQLFLSVHKKLQLEEASFTVIDAGPGTGKTFLISLIILSCRHDALYMVYSKRLMNIIDQLNFSGSSKTCCKFVMDIFKIKYFDAKFLWSCHTATFREKCVQIYTMVLKIKPEDRDEQLYILDEDSIVSPWYIFFLYIFAKIYNKHVIFIGDRYQQNSITKTFHHNECNYSLIRSIQGITNVVLTERVRQKKDLAFINVLEKINCIFQDVDTEVKMTFDVKFTILNLLYSHFILEETFDGMYFSQFHVMLKARLDRYEGYLKEKSIKYDKVGFCKRVKNKYVPYTNKSKKYIDYILLVVGEDYVYIPNNVSQYRVQLIRVEPDVLTIKNYDTFEILQIRRISLHAFLVAEEFIAILPPGLFQFPLKNLTSTYHAAQGLTIGVGKIDLDLDASTLNSFYVGITRIVAKAQLLKIHTSELINLLITLQKNDEYYYRVCRLSPHFLKSLDFTETRSLDVFSGVNIYQNIKIRRDKFKIKLVQTEDTNLTKLVKLLGLTPIDKYLTVMGETFLI